MSSASRLGATKRRKAIASERIRAMARAQSVDLARLASSLSQSSSWSPSAATCGIELLADRPGEGGDEVARIEDPARLHLLDHGRGRGERAAGDRIDLAAPHPHPDRDQPVGILELGSRPGRAG